METTRQRTWHDVEIKGKWRLEYTVGNSQGSAAFGGYHLPIYPNPFTGQKTFLKNVDNKAIKGYLIDKINTPFNPDTDGNHKYLISWLICHPEVRVEGVNDLPQEILSKKKGSKIRLVYLDFEELNKFEEEDYIDKLIGLLSLDLGKNMISLAKLRYILAYLDLPYREPRYEVTAEKKALRSKLKSWVRKSHANAKAVNSAIENMDDAQNAYEFKELIREKILTPHFGVYKFRQTPIGGSLEAVTTFFNAHPEVKTEALTLLHKK